MIEKHTKQLLQHGYTTTVVFYPFEESSIVGHGHIIGSDREVIRNGGFRTCCIINKGEIIEKSFGESWDYMLGKSYFYQKNETIEEEEEELLYVDSYMNELYKLYQKGNQRSENEEKIRILLEESFSERLSRAVMREKNDYSTFKREKADDNHYIVVVPSEWADKKTAAESILRPIFIDAGLINRDDPPCRLIFLDTLSAIFYSFQKHLSDPDEEHWLKYGTVKKNKHYALFDVDFESRSKVASIACYLFETGNTNSMVNGIELFQPHNVSCSRSGKINLVSAYTIENNLLGLLYNKKILPLPLSPAPEILTRVSKKEDYDRKIDRLLKKMIQIASAYYMNSKSDNNDLENKDSKSSISQMYLQRPFRNLDFKYYEIEFTKLRPEALEEINMEELYNILFCENETRIKNYTEDCLKEYNKTLQGAVLAEKKEKTFGGDFHLTNSPYASAESEERDAEYKKHADQDSNIKFTVNLDRYNTSSNVDKYYIKLISRIIRSCTEKYFSSTVTDVVEKLQFFGYSKDAVVGNLLSKVQDDVRNSLKFLPPSIIQYPESKYTSILESTEKTTPKYIINIDLSLQSCKYLFLQADKDTKENGIKIDYGSKTKVLDVFSLNRFIRVKPYTSANLHISQKMLNYLLESAHFQATLDYFAKYDRKVIRGSGDLHEYEKVCDEEDINLSELPSPFGFSSSENKTLLPTIVKLFEKHDYTSKDNPILTVHRPSYIMAFIVIYFIYLESKIDAIFKQYYTGASDEISYAVSVEELLLDTCLMGSKSIMKELLIASGLTNELTIRKQLRVISQDEYSFPIMQKKAKLDLPLKSYYVHAQLYKSSIQLVLNQVVKKEPHPMIIVVKSDIIPTKHMHELLCDNLWNQIQSHCHKSVCERHRVDRNENLEEEREYSMTDRLEFEKSFMQYVRNLPSLKKSTDFEGLEIPKGGSSCKCSVHLTHADLVELSIKPVLKTIVSSILSTLTNDQIFGEYYISTLFVTFDSILNSVFHYSYKDLLKSIIEHKIKTRLENKRLEIPYFVFLDSESIDMIETRNRTFSNLFSEGSLSQVFSATYVLQLKFQNRRYIIKDIKVYTKDPKTLRLSQVSTNDGGRILITILERGDQLSFKKEGIKKKVYICFSEEEEEEEEEEEKEKEKELNLYTYFLRFDSKVSEDTVGDDKLGPKNSEDSGINLVSSFWNVLDYDDYITRRDPKAQYMPLYINIKPLGYRSSIEISFEYGHSFDDEEPFAPELFKAGELLTLKNTQYIPQVKKKEGLTKN